MREKPRKNSDFIITRPMIRSIVGVGIVFVAALLGMLAWFGQGITPYELSVFFTVFVMLQFWNMFNAKGFGSRSTVCTHMKGCSAFYGVLLLILVGQIAIVTWGGDVFRTVPITLRDWAIIVGGTSLVMWAGRAVALDQAPTTRLIPRGAVLSRALRSSPACRSDRRAGRFSRKAVRRHSRKETATHRPTILSMFLIPEKRRKRAKKRDKIMKRIDKTTDRKVLLQIISVKIFR